MPIAEPVNCQAIKKENATNNRKPPSIASKTASKRCPIKLKNPIKKGWKSYFYVFWLIRCFLAFSFLNDLL